METESTSKEGESQKSESEGTNNKETTPAVEKADVAEKKDAPEPTFQLLSNPARVLPQQVSGKYGSSAS